MHDKRSVDVSGLLDLVGDDATHKVRMSGVQVSHQLHQGLSAYGRNGKENVIEKFFVSEAEAENNEAQWVRECAAVVGLIT